MFEQLANSEALFRLNQEGYVVLVSLLIVFTVSIILSNLLGWVLVVFVRSLDLTSLWVSGIQQKRSTKASRS